MKVFLDANILVSVLNKEYPLFSYSARILSLSTPQVELYSSPICLAIAYYFVEKKSGAEMAKNKIALLLRNIHIAEVNKEGVLLAVQNKAILDFEDGLEYYSALNAGCTCIVTGNIKDFYFSEIEVWDPARFLQNCIKNN